MYKLFQAFSTPNSRNVLISPIGLKLVLALLYEGSGGLTEKEFQNILQFPIEKSKMREHYKNISKALQVFWYLLCVNLIEEGVILAKRKKSIYFKFRDSNFLRFSGISAAEFCC